MLVGLKKHMEASLGNLFNSMNLRKKILLLYLFVVVIPVILLGLTAESVMFNFLKSDYSVSANEAVDQVVKNVEFRKLTYELLVTRTAMDGELAARLTRDYSDFFSQWETVSYIDRSFGTIRESLPGVEYFRIYHANDTLVEDGGILWKPNGRVLAGKIDMDWYMDMKSNEAPMLWDLYRDPKNGSLNLTLSRRISRLTGGDMSGAVILNVRSGQVFENLLTGSFNGYGDAFLLNAQGVIFASSCENYIGKEIGQTPLKSLSESEADLDTVMEFDGSHDIVVSRRFSSGWRIIAAVPLKNLENRTKTLSMWIIGITLSLVLLSAVLMLAVINNIVFRLRSLENKVSAVTKGKFNVAVTGGYADELGDLEERFNLMTSRLGDLTNEIALVRTREREEALKALQAQINPHFLYNTLGIIRWRALDVADLELCRLVDAMTVFYRLSLNKGNSVLHIRQELEHIKAYVEIQQIRYMNSVNVNWDVDPSVLDLYTIKLILQPVVENSYMHGMIAKRGHGALNISIARKEESVVFAIQDNGIGIADDDMPNFANAASKPVSSGYGLSNIRERLRLYFGEKGKLHINSRWGRGTTITIEIPVCTEPPLLKEGIEDAESTHCG